MIFKIIFLLNLISIATFANTDCQEITDEQISGWNQIRPETPALTDLFKAKKIVDQERSYSLKLGNDKTAHCYLGCRIADSINLETAQFTAWQKELNDATDCNANTKFELADYDATLAGAKFITTKETKIKCSDFCKKNYPRNRKK